MGRLSKEEILKDKRTKSLCPICGFRAKVVINSIRNIYSCLNCGNTNMRDHDYSKLVDIYDHE